MGGIRGRWLVLPAALAMAVGLVACGGSAPGSSAAPQPPSEAATTGPGATDPGTGPASSDPGPSATDTPQPRTSGNLGLGDVCSLVTADEMGRVLGVSVVQEVFPGPPDTCAYSSNGLPLAAIVLLHENLGGTSIYEAMRADASSQEFDGIGDRALYNQQGQFMVLRGDRLMTLVISEGDWNVDQRIELAKEVGRIAAGRM